MDTPYNSEIPTQQWVLERQHYIGGSEAAAILGESSFKTPLQVWMRKQGLLAPQESTPITDFGHIFEPIMAEYFENLTGLKTRRVSKPFVHPQHEFLRANIDRQVLSGDGVEGTGVLELKTTTSHRLKALGDQYPDEWEYQVQHYLGITGYRYGYLFIYERDTCHFYEPILIRRNEKLIEAMTGRLTGWWQAHMVEGQRPAPMGGEDLLLLYPDSSDGKVIEANRDSYECYEELIRLRDRKSDLEKREEYLKNQLKDELGDAERLVLGGRTLVSWKSYSQSRLDSTTLREEQPEVYDHYLTETNYRRFTVK